MTPLRTRFIEDVQLHCYSPKTQSCYVGAVCGLAMHLPQISGLDLRRRTASLFPVPHPGEEVARHTATIALCGIKFIFQNTFQRDWNLFKLLRPPQQKETSRCAQPGRSPKNSRLRSHSHLPGLFDDDLFLPTAPERRSVPADSRCRFSSEVTAHKGITIIWRSYRVRTAPGPFYLGTETS